MALSALQNRWPIGIAFGVVLLLGAATLVRLRSEAPRRAPPPLRPTEPVPARATQPPTIADTAPARTAYSESRPEPFTRAIEIRLRDLRQACFRTLAAPNRDGSSQAGPRYAGEPISKFSIRIPTNTRGPVPFDFCVDEIRLDQTLVPWGRGGVFDSARNEFGLSGPWFHFGDDVTIWERPAPGRVMGETVGPGAPVCIKGTAPQVFENQFDDYWGAALGFHFIWSTGEVPLYEPEFETLRVLLRGPKIPTRLGFYVDDDQGRGTPPRVWCELTR